MARIEEKKVSKKQDKLKADEKGKTAVIIVLSVIALALLALIIVVLVKQLTNKDEEETEKTYEAIYTKDNTDQKLIEITWADFDNLLDLNEQFYLSNAPEGYKTRKDVSYVFIYSPDTETYETVKNEELIAAVTNAIKNTPEGVGFYVLNVLSKDNKDTTSENKDTYTSGWQGYNLVVVDDTKASEERIESFNDKLVNVTAKLNNLLAK